MREAADRGDVELPPQRRAVLETGIRLHRWWAERWSDLDGGPLLE